MEREHIEFRLQQLAEPAQKISRIFFDVVNGLKPISELGKAIKEWEEKRQILNNKNIGVILMVLRLGTKPFTITGDLKKDIGQVNKSKPKE